MNYKGDVSFGDTVNLFFETIDPATGSSATPTTGTLEIYKDGSAVPDTNGITLTADFNGITGLHLVTVDTSDGTTPSFFAAGSDYVLVFNGATVGAATINIVIGTFSIKNRTSISVQDIIDGITDGALTLDEILRVILSAVAGKTSGGGTNNLRFRDSADTKDRIIATVDVDQNRVAVTLDGTA